MVVCTIVDRWCNRCTSEVCTHTSTKTSGRMTVEERMNSRKFANPRLRSCSWFCKSENDCVIDLLENGPQNSVVFSANLPNITISLLLMKKKWLVCKAPDAALPRLCKGLLESAYSCIIYRNSKIHLDWITENAETTRSIHSQARKCSR